MKTLIASLFVVLGLANASSAVEIEVKMLNKGAGGETMVFEPAVVTAEIGDTIRFVPTDRGHNAATVRGALPDGAVCANGKMNKELVYEITADGIHLFKCTPHLALGMLAVVVVGSDLSNEDALLDARMPKRAEKRLAAYLEEARTAVSG